MDFFEHVVPTEADSILGLTALYIKDPRPFKVNLSVGIYRDETLQSLKLNSVKKAESEIFERQLSKEYLPISGSPLFIERTSTLILGETLKNSLEERLLGVQTLGGTGALRLGGDFLFSEFGKEAALSDPTWPNHRGIFSKVGMKILTYSYYDFHRRKINFSQMLTSLKKLSAQTIVILHACCHNPTGEDLSPEEWRELSTVMKEKKLFPFFDLAYQGLGTNLATDAFAPRLFAEDGHQFFIASSFSKNFGLYAERVGVLLGITSSSKEKENLVSRMKTLARTNYSSPPLHGAEIVSHLLGNSFLKTEWEREVATMQSRIQEMRYAFITSLQRRISNIDFSYLKDNKGLFSFCPLSKIQVKQLMEEYAIYMTNDGRVNLAGLNFENLERVTEAIQNVI